MSPQTHMAPLFQLLFGKRREGHLQALLCANTVLLALCSTHALSFVPAGR